ncbi:MAG: hypothetical protein ICV83_15035 [Cytophagales bacterium]|nr:hypothetical protein [Cytophagales bacterium]
MKNAKTKYLLLVASVLHLSLTAQPVRPSRLTYSARLTFQAYGLPFQNLREGFRNVGGSVGVDYAYNAARTLHQTVALGYQGHTEHEQGFYLHTQLAYRPLLLHRIEPGIAIGVGRLLSVANPKNPYYQVGDGGWQRSGKQTQGHWLVPLTASLGYRVQAAGGTVLTPFVAYEVSPVIGYNSAFPVLPYSLVTFGTRIQVHPANHSQN